MKLLFSSSLLLVAAAFDTIVDVTMVEASASIRGQQQQQQQQQQEQQRNHRRLLPLPSVLARTNSSRDRHPSKTRMVPNPKGMRPEEMQGMQEMQG